MRFKLKSFTRQFSNSSQESLFKGPEWEKFDLSYLITPSSTTFSQPFLLVFDKLYNYGHYKLLIPPKERRMFDDLKEKMEGLVNTIKSKLPGGKSDDDEYEDDDEFEVEGDSDEKTEEIQVKDKLKADSDDEDFDDEDEDFDEEDDEDDEEAEKKKKKQKIIKLGLVALVVVLAADMFLGGEEEKPQVKTGNFKRPKRPKRKKRKPKKVVKKVVEKDVAKKKKVEAKKEVEKTTEVKKEKAIAPKKEEEPPKKIVDNTLELNNETKPPTADPLPLPEEPAPTVGESPAEPVEQGDDLSKALDQLSKESDESKMIKSVVKEKLEYQEPPNYRNTGRGLTYNCTGKHWACVDQESYMNCKKNYDWSKQNTKAPECYPSNIYRSFKDCRTIQIDNINTLAETKFCE